MNASALIDRYFDLAPLADTDAYFAQFAHDANVEDEGHDHHGLDAIRAWRHDVPSVAYAVREVTNDGSTHVARAEISGDFPGSPVELSFRFDFAADGRIGALAIRV
jgi:hypothetical protein